MRIPTSSSKSNLPNWLDKLRKVKGFPSVNDGHSLDHFLSEQHLQQRPNEAADGDLHPVKRRSSVPENDGVSNRMANMLSDLFSDGRSSRSDWSSDLKSPRKQPSPRICILPVPAAAAAAAVTEDKGSHDSDRVVFVDDRNLESKRKVRRGLKEEGKGKLGECELVGFSRTEVTVIDSSNPLWKFDKYLFRKKNVWKARDRKRGARNYSVGIGRKKKRDGLDDEDDRIVVSKISKSFGERR